VKNERQREHEKPGVRDRLTQRAMRGIAAVINRQAAGGDRAENGKLGCRLDGGLRKRRAQVDVRLREIALQRKGSDDEKREERTCGRH
jgi:hypothetical protein